MVVFGITFFMTGTLSSAFSLCGLLIVSVEDCKVFLVRLIEICVNLAISVVNGLECRVRFKDLSPVSYTHLDVYKRQVYGELPNPEIDKNKKIDLYCCLNDARHTKWGGKLCSCLLYTSRCV